MVAEPALSNFALKNEVAAYWSARATRFDASSGHGMAPGAERSAWMELVSGRLGPLHGKCVLERGSGTGEFTRLLLDAGATVTGLDLSDGMPAQVRAKLAGHPASFFAGDAEDTREPTACHDAAVCRHLVWTLPAPRRATAKPAAA